MVPAITRAQPSLDFIPPQYNPWLQAGMKWLLPWITPHWAHLTRIEVAHAERLAQLYAQFQQQQARFLIAFRHPSVNDPFCLAHLLYQSVPQAARQHQIPLKAPIHAHFIYDRGIPLWAGQWMGWLYAQLGGIPIQRGKVDRIGLKTARDVFANGQFPLLAAPEGATNGHGEIISPLEPGIAQMGFWCAEDLAKANRSEQVWILPVGLQYRYVTPPWSALAKLLMELETAVGITPLSRPDPETDQPSELFMKVPESERPLYQRLYRLGEQLLTAMEQFYQRFYHQSLESDGMPVPEPSASSADSRLAARLHNLMNTALQVSEQYFGLSPKGSFIDRCRRLEQAGWDWIYREDVNPSQPLPAIERGFADVVATEASLRMWHMRMVESFVAVTGNYVSEKPTAERFAETTLLLWDLITRIQGKQPHLQRPVLGKQWAQVTVGEPLSVSDRWPSYQTNRRQAKQAVADLTQDIHTALANMIVS